MFVNNPLILELVALLKSHGVLHVVISPGSRHYPIVRTLEADPEFTLYSVVDERSAGFFAIGVIRATGSPAAVLTTSGTAAVNLASAVADAYYQRLPLVAITADRPPQLLNQMEDQMIDQSTIFAGTLRGRAILRLIHGDIDHWYDNRILNEALLAMRVNGVGPIHINVPIPGHTGLDYSIKELPSARVISHHTPTSWGTDWSEVSTRLRGKRVMVLWGQSDPPDGPTLSALNHFASRTDSLIVADHLGNLNHEAALSRPFASVRSGRAQRGDLRPDVIITVGGTLFLIDDIRNLIADHEVEHWRVDPDGGIVDPFWQLTDVFQVTIRDFFSNAVASTDPPADHSFRDVAREISSSVPKPKPKYGELSVIGGLLDRLTPDVSLHIANSAPMRMTHVYEITPGVSVLGNRGVNGIDGSMSSTIGYAVASQKPTFLVIGDLSFFYDMNSLGIRDIPSTLRILVINNGGGALMHAPLPPSSAKSVAVHTSAEHSFSVRGWAESVGFEYLEARDDRTYESALAEFVPGERGKPILLEAFTEKVADIEQLKGYHASNAAVGSSTYRKARRIAGRTLRKLGIRG